MSIVLLAVVVTVASWHSGGLQRLEWFTYDARMQQIRGETQTHPDIAVILIDEATLQAMNPVIGRWPWPRAIYSDLLDFLSLGEPRAVVFDILFSEYQRSMDEDEMGEDDEIFAWATMQQGNVIHAFQILQEEDDEIPAQVQQSRMPQEFANRFALPLKGDLPPLRNHTILPFTELYQGALGAGVVNMQADADGIFRRVPLAFNFDGEIYPALSLAPLIYTEERQIVRSQDGYHFNGRNIPFDRRETFLPNYYGEFNAYSMGGIFSSLQAIIRGDMASVIVDPAEFHDKIVFIGASAIGLQDVKTTPLSPNTPGVYIHASVASNILMDDYLQPVAYNFTYIAIGLLALVSLVCVFLFQRLWLQVGLPALCIAAYVVLAWWQFGLGYAWDVIPPFTAGALSWFGGFAYLSFTESKDKRKVRRMLSQYVSPAILTEVVDRYDTIAKADVGTTENLTILFSDIRSFTNISEKMSASEVVDLLNIYLTDMCDVIFDYQGTLDKFIGDAIMAFWGAPIRIDDHADQALSAAMEMERRLPLVNEKLLAKGYPELKIGIGLHTGEVVLGNIGSERKLDYTIIGDNVNLGSRTEGLTKEFGSTILLTESTFAALTLDIPCAQVDLVRVKGKTQPIALYRPLAKPEDPTHIYEEAKRTAQLVHDGFEAYLHRNWEKAIECFASAPAHPSLDSMIDRCRRYQQAEPPADWDGVHTMQTK
ncbi:CHASE2 domain-containing protein [Desulfurispira natronophila]|uniref:Adenylate cyclase n=1 Tax=Desulfurispira natronophila TaxID=682562 RepID=A0A7W7Y2L9_9BACT|nr:adenylate/guanylate cyclase domain-containing protein [Desulfurispira natronophila]MBB5020936.1 adenylate cyclase [Desulfurispira natronophila]